MVEIAQTLNDGKEKLCALDAILRGLGFWLKVDFFACFLGESGLFARILEKSELFTSFFRRKWTFFSADSMLGPCSH